jgi:mannose-1-phosphate guanylyltransferase
MLEETIARVAPLMPPAHVLVVTGRAHAHGVRARLATRKRARILVEPRRGTRRRPSRSPHCTSSADIPTR